LANYAAGPTISLSGVVSSDHRTLLQFLSKDAPIPKSPNTIKKLLLQKARRIEENLKIEFESHKRFISATLDLWTDKAMIRSFLGATLHYVDGDQLITRCIGVQQLLQRHSAENIKEAFEMKLQVYGLTLNDIFTITTDNGSNVVKAFQIGGIIY